MKENLQMLDRLSSLEDSRKPEGGKRSSMRRWPIFTAAITGAIVGFLCVIYVGTAINLYTSLTATATILVIMVCPVIYLIWHGWWLVPSLNAILYGGIAFLIVKRRSARKRS